MSRVFALVSRRMSLPLLIAVLGAAIPGVASAGGLTVEDMITEVMMGSQGADAITLGAAVGPDSATTLSFTSNVDLTTEDFTYALAPGTKYQGKDLAITAAGVFDSVKNQWALTSTTTFDGTTWDNPGTAFYVGDPVFFDKSTTIFGHTIRLQITEDFSAVGANLISEGHIDLTIDKKVFRANASDKKNAAGQWEYLPGSFSLSLAGGDFQPRTTGQTPPAGGAGQFDVQVLAVPEPSSFALVAIGLGVIMCLSRKLHPGHTECPLAARG